MVVTGMGRMLSIAAPSSHVAHSDFRNIHVIPAIPAVRFASDFLAAHCAAQIELFAKFRAVSRYGHDFRHAVFETHSHDSHAPDVKSEKPRKSRERKTE
jgi:hypothetical protein